MGDVWYIKLVSGWKIEFISYNEAWEYYNEHKDD